MARFFGERKSVLNGYTEIHVLMLSNLASRSKSLTMPWDLAQFANSGFECRVFYERIGIALNDEVS